MSWRDREELEEIHLIQDGRRWRKLLRMLGDVEDNTDVLIVMCWSYAPESSAIAIVGGNICRGGSFNQIIDAWNETGRS